jgi:hypothetical protein
LGTEGLRRRNQRLDPVHPRHPFRIPHTAISGG